MHIIKAQAEHFEAVKSITHKTISEIYPRYYPKGVVDFFLAHHRDENIRKDIAAEMIAEEYVEIYVHPSLPAKSIYINRGYEAVEAHTIVAENGDVLCYDLMKTNSISLFPEGKCHLGRI